MGKRIVIFLAVLSMQAIFCLGGFGVVEALPRWAPNGKKYAVVEKTADSSSIKIYEVGEDQSPGGETVGSLDEIEKELFPEGTLGGALGGTQVTLSFFDWSPDSKSFVFTSMGNNSYELFVSIDGDAPYQLTVDSRADLYPRWSPDGRKIVFTSDGRLYLFSSASKFKKKEDARLKAIDLKFGNGSVKIENTMFPEWSPDSSSIAFTGQTGGDYDIYIYNVMLKTARRVIRTGDVNEYHPVFSPDGKWLAFYSKKKTKDSMFDIAISPVSESDRGNYRSAYPDGGGAIPVAAGVLQNVLLGPAWMPSSRHLVYVRNDEGSFYPIEVAEFTYQESSPEVVVSEPIRLNTKTDQNTDLQCTRTGIPRLVFQHYNLSDYVVEPLDMSDVYSVLKQPENLLLFKPRANYEISGEVNITDPLSTADFALGALANVKVSATVRDTNNGTNYHVDQIDEYLEAPIMADKPAEVLWPKKPTVIYHVLVKDQCGKPIPLKEEEVSIGGTEFRTSEEGYIETSILKLSKNIKDDLPRAAISMAEALYSLESTVVDQAETGGSYNAELTFASREFEVSFIVRSGEDDRELSGMTIVMNGESKKARLGGISFSVMPALERNILAWIGEYKGYETAELNLRFTPEGKLVGADQIIGNNGKFTVTVTLRARIIETPVLFVGDPSEKEIVNVKEKNGMLVRDDNGRLMLRIKETLLKDGVVFLIPDRISSLKEIYVQTDVDSLGLGEKVEANRNEVVTEEFGIPGYERINLRVQLSPLNKPQTENSVRIVRSYKDITTGKLWRSSAIPGWGHHYAGNNGAAAFFFFGEVALMSAVAHTSRRYSEENAKYEDSVAEYEMAITDISAAKERMDILKEKRGTQRKWRTRLIIGATLGIRALEALIIIATPENTPIVATRGNTPPDNKSNGQSNIQWLPQDSNYGSDMILGHLRSRF